jgi:hypothetical protein
VHGAEETANHNKEKTKGQRAGTVIRLMGSYLQERGIFLVGKGLFSWQVPFNGYESLPGRALGASRLPPASVETDKALRTQVSSFCFTLRRTEDEKHRNVLCRSDVKGKAGDYYEQAKETVASAVEDGKAFVDEKKHLTANAVHGS